MQRDQSAVSENEEMQSEGDCNKAQSDTDWLLPLLWNYGQYRKYNGIPIQHHEKPVLLPEPEKPEEKL